MDNNGNRHRELIYKTLRGRGVVSANPTTKRIISLIQRGRKRENETEQLKKAGKGKGSATYQPGKVQKKR